MRGSIYDALLHKLQTIRAQSIRLSFSEVEEIIGRPLPGSAYRFNAWWGNETSLKAGHSQANAWMRAGFEAKVSLKQRLVEFRRPPRSIDDTAKAGHLAQPDLIERKPPSGGSFF